MRFVAFLVVIALIVLAACPLVTLALMEIPIIGLTIDHKSAQLELGKLETLSVTIRPDSATNKELVWSSGNPRVVEVTAVSSKDDNPQKATITALAGGTATVTARTLEGDKSVQCLVTVTIPVKSINITPEKATLDINEQFKLHAELEPADATEQKIIWESSDGEVASVFPDGTVVAKETGQVNIIARSLQDKGINDFSVITVTEVVAAPVTEPEAVLDLAEEGEEVLNNKPEFEDQEDSEDSNDNEQGDDSINYLYIIIGALVTLGIIIVIFIVNRR